jgi:hypothetical protein
MSPEKIQIKIHLQEFKRKLAGVIHSHDFNDQRSFRSIDLVII